MHVCYVRSFAPAASKRGASSSLFTTLGAPAIRPGGLRIAGCVNKEEEATRKSTGMHVAVASCKSVINRVQVTSDGHADSRLARTHAIRLDRDDNFVSNGSAVLTP
eukprot:1177934-Prorocentrum_minimum.AAC.2